MIENLFSLALWLAGIGHFIVLIASIQVPSRFGWKEDFAKLTPFNRKLVWTYAIYIFGIILTFGILTLFFHDEFLRGDKTAMGLAVFIGLFWLVRVGIDFFSFRHKNWPQSDWFVMAHLALLFLFICLAGTYLGLFIWKTWFA